MKPSPSFRTRVWRALLAAGAAGLTLSCLAATSYQLSPGAALSELAAGETKLTLDPGAGGFSGREVKSDRKLDFSKGDLKQNGESYVFRSKSAEGLSLYAEFQPKDGYVLVEGYLESSKAEDRAVILDYRVGLTGSDLVFSNALNAWEDAKVPADGAEVEGNAFPVAALQSADKAVAVGIPGDAPCSFGMVGSKQGLTVRFYLGVTPETKAFPNRARFSFIVYPAVPGWGFRSALAGFYSFYPKQYEPRQKRAGYYMYMVKGLVPENIDQYSSNVLEIHNPHVKEDLDRDDKHQIDSLLYTLIGQREIKFLPKLPANFDEAMKAFENWTVESHKKFPVTKENAVSGEDRWLKQEVESSAAKGPDGKYVLTIRNTPWGKNSVSFKSNPSPYLFADKDVFTVGRDSTKLIQDWLKQYPQIDGVIVDSLGANWPATANYRRDHIAYAQYPVTFDPEGRLFINNDISHYEWAKYMWEKVLKPEQYLTGNGVYAYQSSIPEHYRAKDRRSRIKIGRFFISSLLDGGASEAGARASTDRCQDARIMFGHKYYALTNYEWEDEAKVKQFYNRALAYAIFASNTKNYFGNGEYVELVNEGVSYVDNPHGYFRDKALTDWFLPKAQMLHKAGWQPITSARITEGGAKTLFVERYGQGNNVYFAIFNDSATAAEISLKVDMPALGFTEGAAEYQELAYSAPLTVLEKDEFKLKLEPYHTYIVSMSKTWLWGQNSPARMENAAALALIAARAPAVPAGE